MRKLSGNSSVRMVTVPALPRRLPMPCLMAFSTSGCTDRHGSMKFTARISYSTFRFRKRTCSIHGIREYYELRKETIERVFAMAKELLGFRYTQEYGKAHMEIKAALTFACINLKKLAKSGGKTALFHRFCVYFRISCSLFSTSLQQTRFRPKPKAGLSTV